LPGRKIAWHLRLTRKKRINGKLHSWAGDQSIVVKDHDSAVGEPPIKEVAAVEHRLIDIDVDMDEAKR
jgi:hypothetical protein